MASSGYMSTSNPYVKFYVEVEVNAQSIEENYTSVNAKVYAVRTNTGYTTWGAGTCTLIVNGLNYSTSGTYTITSTPVLIGEVSRLRVNHNDDGSKALVVTAALNMPDILSSSQQSYSEELPFIPRASKPTINLAGGDPTVNIGSSYMGVELRIFTHRRSAAFRHKITVVYNGVETLLCNPSDPMGNLGDVYYPFAPNIFAPMVPNKVSAPCTVYLETFNGSTSIGKYGCTFNLVLPDNVVPSIGSLSIVKVNGVIPVAWDSLIQSKSAVQVTVNNPVAGLGSSISQIYISGGGYSAYNTNPFTTGVLNFIGTTTMYAEITDARGRKASASIVTPYVYEYYNPFISGLTMFRCTSAGVANDDGTHISLKAKAEYAVCNNKNSYVLQYRYRVVNGTWSAYGALPNNTATVIGGGTINVDNSYEVQVRVADYFTESVATNTIPTAYVTMDFKKGGKGIAIGTVSTQEGVFEIALPVDASKVNGVVSEGYIGSIDLNSYYKKSCILGIYNFANGPNGAALDARIATLEVLRYSDDWVVQRVSYISSQALVVYQRVRHSGTTWSPWQHMYNDLINSNLTIGRRVTLASGAEISNNPMIFATTNGTDGTILSLQRNNTTNAGCFTLGQDGLGVRFHLYTATGAWNNYYDFTLDGARLYRNTRVERILGMANNFYIGANVSRIEADATFRIYNSAQGAADTGLWIDANGAAGFKVNNSNRHVFWGDGTKTGGTMEVEGTIYGMSPTDSPQTLIEYIDFDIVVNGEKEVFLDPIYSKMISKFTALLSNSNIKIKEKRANSIVLVGNGTTDIIFKGQRKGAQEYFKIMNGFTSQGYIEGGII